MLREYGIDGSDVTIEFADPLVIREAWDAGLIDGAGCWGNTLHHLLHNPHGGNNETGHLIMDAATVRRWGYATTNKLVTTVTTLFELEQDQIGNSFQRTRSGTGWMKGNSFKRLAHTGHLKRSDSRTLSPGSSPASTHSSVGPRGQHRGAFFRASVANLDA